MNCKIFTEFWVPGLLVGIIGFGGHSAFQDQDNEEVEIVDQDGQRVEVRGMKWQGDGQQKNIDVQVGDGKIIIVDENGKRREIDVTGAQNIIVNKSVRSIIRDGEEEKQVTGKAIIVGPDGKKQVIQLGDLELGNEEGIGGLLHVMPLLQDMKDGDMPLALHYATGSGGKYMIGVSCEPVSDALRAQLNLDEGSGLVVTSQPGDDSPAATAGIQQHDILMVADQEQLATVEDLVTAVQSAGEEERELSLTLVRQGKEIGVDVKPAARKAMTGKNVFRFRPGGEEFDLRVEKFGPGVIFDHDGDLPADLAQKLESLEENLKLQREELQALRSNLKKSSSNSSGRDQKKDK